MFRVDLKTGRLVAGDDCHTATIPHTLAKRRTKTGNYGLADEARKLHKELVVPIDPKTGKPIFPLSQSQIQAQAALAGGSSSQFKEESESEIKMPEAVRLHTLWNNFDEVDAFLGRGGRKKKGSGSDDSEVSGEGEEGYFGRKVGSTVATRSTRTVRSSSEDEEEEAWNHTPKKGKSRRSAEEVFSAADSESDEEDESTLKRMLQFMDGEEELDFREVFADDRKNRNFPNFTSESKRNFQVDFVDFYNVEKIRALEAKASANMARLMLPGEAED